MKYVAFITLLLAVIALVPMKRLERQFKTESGQSFNIMDLELPFDQDHQRSIFGNLSDEMKVVVRYNIYWDFLFMFAIFGFVASLCFGVRRGAVQSCKSQWLGIVLLVIGILQLVALIFDFSEDLFILGWVRSGENSTLPIWFKSMVYAKFTIGLAGFLVASVGWLYCRFIRTGPRV